MGMWGAAISGISRRWRKLVADTWDVPLRWAVHGAARTSFARFGCKDLRQEYNGMQYTIVLANCEITFWRYKGDLGSAVRPVPADSATRYASKQVAEVGVSDSTLRTELNRQVQMILDSYEPVLLGQIGDWPLEE